MQGRKLCLMTVFVTMVMVLVACGETHIEIENDGSGNVTQTIYDTGMVTAEDVEREVERELEQGSEEVEAIQSLSVNETRESIEVTFDFSNITALEEEAYVIPLQDLQVIEDERLEEVVMVEEGEDLAEADGLLVLSLPHPGQDMGELHIHTPGDTVAHSENIEMKDDRSHVEVTANEEILLIYEEGSSFAGLAIGALIIGGLGAGGWFYWKRRTQNHSNLTKEGDQDASA
ncbi:hypothetical protein [Salsuginibacillus kocurii]|uniref:hypothetical protein n=1 Tax=Salsuginibacillus kocurii TaxID=427078 RepID=UPI0003724917|nr:hypothetical protein [Salsuginibacillus kocurii]